ncbi:hypothetical protein FCJ61_40530 [Burkholderia metallica]|nr:hypothetical protein [Burkholderia metallica]
MQALRSQTCAAISDATFYNWRSRYGGMDVSEARRLRQLEEENKRLKELKSEVVYGGVEAEG